LTKKILAYVQNESANMKAMTIALKSIVSYEALGVIKSFKGTCFDMPSLTFVNMQLMNK
jgi:hypothetical protein